MIKLTDKNKEFGNYTTISNLLDELDLSPLAIALYFHFKRWANAEHKKDVAVKDLMKKYKVDSRAIKFAKQELLDNELITVDDSNRHFGVPDDIQITDIVRRNFEYFDNYRVVNQQLPSCSSTTRPVVNQQLDPLLDNNALKEKKNKEKEEERTHAETAAENKNLSQENHNALPTSSIPKKQNWIGGMSADDAAAYLDRPQTSQDTNQTVAEIIYREFFPTIFLNPKQIELFGKIEQLEVWRNVCKLWLDNGSRASMLGNMIDRYTRDLEYFNSKNKPGEKWNHELAKQPKPKKWSHSIK